MTNLLRLAGSVALMAVAVFFGVLAHVTAQLPSKLDAMRDDLNSHAVFLRGETSWQIEEARKAILAQSDKQMTALEQDVVALVDRHASTSLELVDRRAGEALATVNAGMGMANGQIAGLREDLRPTLANTASLVKDVQASWDDLYFDVKASVASATVAARGIAEASEAVGKAAPAMAEATVATGRSVAGITQDVHTVTSKFTGPRSKKQKVWDGVKLGIYGARLIP